jgi:hypothetical protein
MGWGLVPHAQVAQRQRGGRSARILGWAVNRLAGSVTRVSQNIAIGLPFGRISSTVVRSDLRDSYDDRHGH